MDSQTRNELIAALKVLRHPDETVIPDADLIYTDYGKDSQWNGNYTAINRNGDERQVLIEDDDALAITTIVNNADALLALLEPPDGARITSADDDYTARGE